MGDLTLEDDNFAESGTYLISSSAHWNPLYTYDQPLLILTKWDNRGNALHVWGGGGGLRSVGNLTTGAQILGGTVGVIGTGYDESGVIGVAQKEGQCGVIGHNTSKSGNSFGVWGHTDSPDGIGVAGQSAQSVGVRGESSGVNQAGVWGLNTAERGPRFGVIGSVKSPDEASGLVMIPPNEAAGVLGLASDGTGVCGAGHSGVWGYGRTGTGVAGLSGPGHGVVGSASVQTKCGVFGINAAGIGVGGSSRTGVGVLGGSASHNGVAGLSTAPLDIKRISVDPVFAGVAGVATRGVGVLAQSLAGENAVGLYATAPTTAAIFKGNVVVDGTIYVSAGNNLVLGTPGNKNGAVTFPDGSQRLLCAVESPEAWFEDFGEAVLMRGKARVALDPDFARTVDLRRFHVFITPYGETAGLYVSRRTKRGFDVAERTPGKSSGVRFSWRVVARPKSATIKRFAKTTIPEFAKANGSRRQKMNITMPDTNDIDMRGRTVSDVLKKTNTKSPTMPELPKVPKRGELHAETLRLMKKARKPRGARA
jgi:hypothetical protein